MRLETIPYSRSRIGHGVGDDEFRLTVCRAVDVSLNGMRLALEHELPLGAYLHLGVELPQLQQPDRPLFLVAVVQWCRPQHGEDAGPWLAGLELLPEQDSDIEQWVALVSPFL